MQITDEPTTPFRSRSVPRSISTFLKQSLIERGECHFVVNTVCYWAIVDSYKSSTLISAISKCIALGFDIVYVKDADIYQLIMFNTRLRIPRNRNSILVHVGGLYDPATRKTTPPDIYTQWHPNQPYVPRHRTGAQGIYIEVNKNPFIPNQGMGVQPGTFTANGIICQKSI
uniref:uncharacterized protein LOC120327281 n=1 Tax=Styela clava TaxID=7725 RepID=UPI001939C1E2|nr:uncharacterized protein LOC120327281 [Styela clava]